MLAGKISALKYFPNCFWDSVVLVIRGQESQNKIKEDYQAQVHLDQMVLVIASWEAGSCKVRLNTRATLIRWFS
jgi:hypothetical protein